VEEEFHRYLTINTLTILDMSWEEALTNIEVMRILEIAKSLCHKHNDFRLQIPLKCTLKPQEHRGMDTEKAMLQLRIRDLKRASKIIRLYQESCEAIIEPLTLRMLDGFLQIPETRALFEKVKQKKLMKSAVFRRNYLSIKKLLEKSTIKTILAVAACILDVKSDSGIPSLLLNSSFDSVNERKAEVIRNRFRLITSAKASLSSEEEVYALAERIGLGYSDFKDTSEKIFDHIMSEYVFSDKERFVFAALNMTACYNSVDYPANKPMLDNIERGWACVASRKPPSMFVREEDLRKPDLEYCFRMFSYLGTPSVSVAEDTGGLVKHIIFRTGLPPHVMTELLWNVQLTVLKYFLLSGEADCPFVPLDAKKSCVLTDVKNGSFSLRKSFAPCNDCIAARMLRDVRIQMSRNA
jgi:hypothetical protein